MRDIVVQTVAPVRVRVCWTFIKLIYRSGESIRPRKTKTRHQKRRGPSIPTPVYDLINIRHDKLTVSTVHRRRRKSTLARYRRRNEIVTCGRKVSVRITHPTTFVCNTVQCVFTGEIKTKRESIDTGLSVIEVVAVPRRRRSRRFPSFGLSVIGKL